MKIGLSLPTFGNDGWRSPTNAFRRYVCRAENAGFAGLWVSEHLTRPPGRSYNRLDPLTTLSMVGEATTRIQIGTNVLILPLRKPELVAHRIATLQHLSEERLNLGLGLGWSEEEYEAAGIPFAERGPRFTEGLKLLKELLTKRNVKFEGDYYSVNGLRIEPMTPRHPRLLVGGGGVGHGDNRQVPRAVKDRILKHAEGWIAPPASPDAIESDWKEIKTYLKCNGRDPTTLDRLALTRTHLVPNVKSGLAREKQRRVFKNRREGDSVLKHGLSGDIEEIREGIERYQELGIDHLILESLTHDPTELEHQLQLFEQYLGDLF